MSNTDTYSGCEKCLWSEQCSFKRPCPYYTPFDYDEQIADREELRRQKRFRAEWEEYVAYYNDEA